MSAVLVTILCAFFVARLLLAEIGADERARSTYKSNASVCFVAVGVLVGWPFDGWSTRWVVAGLALGVLGDWFLLGTTRRRLILGLSAFLAGHVAYVIAWSVHAHWTTAAVCVGVAAAATGILLFARASGSLWGGLTVYSLVLGAMVATALSCPGQPLLWCGAVAFALSDVAVARQRFVTESVVNKLWGLPLYYAAQLLIAWSLGT